MKSLICLSLVLLAGGSVWTATLPEFHRICVPNEFYHDCLDLLKDPSEAGLKMKCVAGRDRMECLELIEKRQADVLAVDPEDVYVAYHMKNEDFAVVSEFRTESERDAPFRYEGVIVVKKGSDIKSLKDLQGKKSCHTGFGRNVGYKIPITKLKKAGVLKMSADQTITATERELKSLSQFFSKSCLVGTYSPHPEVDRLLKKKYSNLCALCEQPEQCNYPDKFSGYDGAIRCLDKGDGDVAFTKTLFVKKYFGLAPNSKGEAHPEDFEYLCQDGTRQNITGKACSWAQRPWKGYISNSDNVHEEDLLKGLQKQLNQFFENGLRAQNKEAAKHLLIDSGLVILNKPEAEQAKSYLERAGYKDVIERDGSMTAKITLCVKDNFEMSKCETMKIAAFSRDIRPEFECIQEADCINAVKTKKATLTILDAEDYAKARQSSLEPLVYEKRDNFMVAVIDPSLDKEKMDKLPIKFDKNNQRSQYAAALLTQLRGGNPCDPLPEIPDSQIQIVNSNDLKNYQDKKLICPANLKEPKAITEFKTCNFEANLPRAVFVHTERSKIEKDSYKHAVISLSDSFGPHGKLPDVFKLFGAFHEGQNNVLFNDDTDALVSEMKEQNFAGNEELYNKLSCKSSA